mgnify:CR=1 FL=1
MLKVTVPLKEDRRTRYMFLNSADAWLLLFICAALIAIFLLAVHLIKLKKNVPLFYCWLGAIAVLGGATAFFLPIAVNSGFAKEDDGAALRQAILYTTGGLLGVITLGETHRKNNQEKEKNENDHTRQVYAERRSRYTKAVEQLANEKAAVRLGGIYTLVGLVDEWIADNSLEPDEQQEGGQVIINNLCSYIRSPFPLAEEIEEYEARKELENLQKSESEKLSEEESSRLQILLKRFEDSDEYEKPKDITTDYAKFHEEQDVRRTIFVEMSKRSSAVSVDESKKVTVKSGAWSGFKFDFSRAPIFYPLNNLTIEQGQFSSARFYGNTNFIFAKFTGNADFTGAIFTGNTDFRYTAFNEYAYFVDVAFSRTADFSDATFNRLADFLNADFSGDANFWTATFTGDARFWNATFNRNAYFTRATFNRVSHAYFTRATFNGDTYFAHAAFNGGTHFEGTTFSGDATFEESYFEKYAPIFAYDSGSARFSDQVNWAESNFSVHSGSDSQPIELGNATLDGKTFRIPLGTVVFDPDSWDEESKKYTHISDRAK